MEGQIYTEVDASVLNPGISTMAMISGNPEPIDGQAYVVVWIRWAYDSETGDGGYTGYSWFFNDTNNGLQDYGDEAAFEAYLATENPKNLDDILSTWNPSEKAAFLNAHLADLEAHDCVFFTAQ